MSVTCSCCGEEKPVEQTGQLHCRADVVVCRSCIDWLSSRAGMIDTTPTLPVIDMAGTIAFYESAGFDVESYDAGFAFVHYEDASVFDLDHNPSIDPDQNGAGCFLVVTDADAWHARLSEAALPVTDIGDMPWGMREFALTDPNGNRIRIGNSLPTLEPK